MGRKDKDFLGLEVVSIEDATVVGQVEGMIVDERQKRVVGLLTDLGIYEAKALAYADVLNVGEDSVVIRSSSAVKRLSKHEELAEIAARGVEITGSLGLSVHGDVVGTAGDYYLDPTTGEFESLEMIVDDAGEQVLLVPMSAVIAIGPELVLLAADFAEQAVLAGDSL